MANDTHHLFDSARADRVALRLDDEQLTFADLDEAIGRAGALLRAEGVGAGGRVGVLLPIVKRLIEIPDSVTVPRGSRV
jgi:non-ribosomal peptide synthetase component E (peptide arylation enzyme)